MTVQLETRYIESSVATEIYITATPKEDAPLLHQAQQLFSGIRDILRAQKASILQERVFITQRQTEEFLPIRSDIYGDIDDGVVPSVLCGRRGLLVPAIAVQLHAIRGAASKEIIEVDGIPRGRILRTSGHTYLTLSSVSAPHFAQPTAQAGAMLEKAEETLKQFGANFLAVARTWMWLCDILSWYDDFNQVRNEFFAKRGLIGPGSRQSIPASTGIGLCQADGSKCAMDLIALLQPPDSVQYLSAVGKQQCALEYGSAFSRAARAFTPGGQTVFVSGTASIDASGATTNVGDATGQINTTIENVRAVLKDMQCQDKDVVQAVAYCKSPAVERVFNDLKDALAWPWITVNCDICRPDLLFEIEATAMPQQTPQNTEKPL